MQLGSAHFDLAKKSRFREGLTEAEAAERLNTFGANTLHPTHKMNALVLFLTQFKSPLLLHSGDVVPADGIALESRDLFIDESALSGEPYPVEKKGLLRLKTLAV